MASINGIDSSSLYTLSQLLTNQSTSNTSEVGSLSSVLNTESTNDTSANSVIFSTQGQIYNRLAQLQKTDPDKFKEICDKISTRLSEASEKNGGVGAAELAEQFASAAQSGEMTDLSVSTSSSTSTINSVIKQYYQQYANSQSSGSNSITSILQSIMGQLGIL